MFAQRAKKTAFKFHISILYYQTTSVFQIMGTNEKPRYGGARRTKDKKTRPRFFEDRTALDLCIQLIFEYLLLLGTHVFDVRLIMQNDVQH